MNYIDEINEYRFFCKKYYPYSGSNSFLNDKNNRIFLLHLFQLINLFEIYTDYDVSDNKHLKQISKMILTILLDLLLAIPTNNDLFVSICIRQLSEKLLDLVYSEFCEKDISQKKLLKIQYRFLWEDGIQKSIRYKQLAKRDKEYLNQINNIFKTESDIVHFKNKRSSTAIYLEEIIKTDIKFNQNILKQRINSIHVFCIDLLPRILKIDFNQFSMNQKIEYTNLVNYLKPKPFKNN